MPLEAGETTIPSPIAGSVWKIEKRPGECVQRDEIIMILECMKMEYVIPAPSNGVVKEISVTETQIINEGDQLAVLEVS